VKQGQKSLVLPTEKKNIVPAEWGLFAVRFFLGYLKYCFLTGTVIFGFTGLFFIATNLGVTISFEFLKYFAFINPLFGKESWTGGITELMQIFSILAFIMFLVASLIKFIFKRLLGTHLSIPLKVRMIGTISLITVIWVVDALIVRFSPNLNLDFLRVFFIFYVINLVSAGGYFLLGHLMSTMSLLAGNETQRQSLNNR